MPAVTLQADDIAAIDRYIMTTPLRTPAAQAARDAWVLWHDSTGSYDRWFSRPALDHARNMRLAFQLANATTDAERAEVLDTALRGQSVEQSSGEPDRRNQSGEYSEIGESSLFTRAALYMVAGLGLIALARRSLK